VGTGAGSSGGRGAAGAGELGVAGGRGAELGEELLELAGELEEEESRWWWCFLGAGELVELLELGVTSSVGAGELETTFGASR
jgi:hypothetical protein